MVEIITTYILPTIPALIAWGVARYYEKRDKERDDARLEEQRKFNEANARREAKENAMAEGMQSLLRDNIMRLHRYCMEKKSVRYYEVQNMEHLYHAYHNLGGNGMVTKLYNEFSKLKTVPEEEE